MALQHESRVRVWSAALAVVVGALVLSSSVGAQVVCFADHHRPNDTGDGLSWGAAKQTIQAAVDISAPALCDQIWVAKGIYVQSSPLVIDFLTPDIYGGFDVGDIQLSDRDWVANETTIDGNDAVGNVIVIQNAGAPIIDGFSITGGTSGGSGDKGGGIRMVSCSGSIPIVRNNLLYANGNNNYFGGGAIYNGSCSPVIVNNVFRGNNVGGTGGAILNENSSAIITNNTFTANYSDETGGAISNMGTGTPVITNNILWDDISVTQAPEIMIFPGAAAVIQYNDIDQSDYPACISGGTDANGNICQDPLLYGSREHLRAGSPAIDAGTNAAPGLPATDFEGDPRVIDGDENGTATVDMGADELEPGQTFGIWYVNGGVATTGSGTSWGDPMKTIHEALASALAGEEVWVKAGSYLFATSATSLMNVGVYGGFAGGETQRDQRDPSANETILDGQNSSGTLSVGSGTVDGFTVTRSTGHGAGTASDCTFHSNPGPLNADIVRFCRFESNTGSAFSGSGAVEDSVFVGNTRSGLNGRGGAINAGISTVVERCKFLSNSAGSQGGAIYVGSGGNLDLRNSLFVSNQAGADKSSQGGGAVYTYNSPISVANSTFYGNAAVNSGMGGAIGSYFNETTYTVVNSVFRNNTDGQGGWSKNLRGNPTVTYSILDETKSGSGNVNGDPLFIDPDGADNTLGTEDDDLRLGTLSPAADAGNNTGVDVCAVDLDRGQRLLDEPDVTDTGNGTAPITDMGAYERGGWATQYALAMAATGSGTTDPVVGIHHFPVCSVVDVTAIPAAGWSFSGWTGGVADPGSAMTTVTVLGVRSATANFFQPATADLSIAKSNHQVGVTIGSSITYTIVVSNAGPDGVTGAAVEDILPSDLDSCSWTCAASGGASCTASPGMGALSDTADIPAGDSVTYAGECDVSAGASGTLENTTTVTAPGGVTDGNLVNNSATDSDALSSDPPVSIELFGEESGSETVAAQETITVTNLIVKAGAVLTLRAGEAVILGDGVVVEDGATLIIEIDPTLVP